MPLKFYIRILKFENKTIDDSWGSREHCEPFWRIYINKCNGANIETPEEIYSISHDHIHFVPAWVRFRCHNTRTLQHFYVHFEPVGISSSILRSLFHRPFRVKDRINYDQVNRFPLNNLTGETSTDLISLSFVKSLVYRAFTSALLSLPKSHYARVEHMINTNHIVDRVLQYIEENMDTSLDNDYLANVACMSKSHFIRTFHKIIGQTPAEYVQERRVVTAAFKLTTSDDSIDQIAQQYGFTNRFYFSRVFHKIMGTSPAAYRNIPDI